MSEEWVFVASPESGSPAYRALRQEGVPAVEKICADLYDYGWHFADLWERGEPFVMVEWDIVPWPGAVAGLLACPNPYCTHEYPLTPGRLANSFGIGKYAPTGPAPDVWRITHWARLDGAVVPHLQLRLGRVHIHTPPVAHAKIKPYPTP